MTFLTLTSSRAAAPRSRTTHFRAYTRAYTRAHFPAHIRARFLAPVLLAILTVFAIGLGTGEAQAKYRIGAGDQLQIEVLEDSTLNRQVLVLPDGTISFPLVGTLPAQGMTIEDLRRDLAGRLTSNFAGPPTVSVSVSALAREDETSDTDGPTIDIYVMGEIQGPGKKEVDAGTTLLQFLAESGGLTPFAAQSRIELHRADQVYLFSYNNKLGRNKTPRISSSTKLVEGDVIVIPTRKLFE